MRLLRRLSQWLRLRTHDLDLRDELALHRDLVERELLARGLSPAAAREAARRAMGNETLMREDSRAVWIWPWLEALRQDVQFTVRSLRNSAGFSLAVILTLALGLGANAAMFSVVDRLLFRPPPLLVDPALTHRVYLYRTSRGIEAERSGQYRRYVDLVRWTASFSRTAAVSERIIAVGTGDAVRELPVAVVSASFFGFFDAPPALGRYFTAAEDEPPVGVPVVVLSNAIWKTQYDARRDVLGAKLQIGPTVYTIIGVAPPTFVGLWPESPPAVFVSVTSFGGSRDAPAWWSSYDHAIGITMIARRKPGISVAAATGDLTTALRRSYQMQLDERPDPSSTLETLRPRAVVASILTERGPESSSLANVATWLSAVAVIVLLIACANVANLLLARAMRRRRELAVRVALGISRKRLASQLITESLLLAIAGGMAGVAIAQWASALLRGVFLPGMERVPILSDLRTALFAVGLTLAVGVLSGLIPGLQVGRVDLTEDLKSAARAGGTYPRSRLRSALLVGQSALCVTLLAGAGLFVRSMRNVREVRLGYDVDPVLIVDLSMRGVKLDSARRATLNQRLLSVAQTLPGVAHASLMKTVPFEGISSWPLFVEGIDSVDRFGEFDLNGVSADYFATMGTRILHGRAIEEADRADARKVMVVDQSMAAVLWPGRDPIGRCVRIGADTSPCTYVVGIAENIHTRSLGDEHGVFIYYLPIAQMTPDYVGLYVRSREGIALLEPLRRRLQQEMPGTGYVTVRPFRQIINSETQSWRVGATAFTIFGALAVVLASLGLYSVIAYGVTQRTHELGVRMALGARAVDVVRLVVADGLRFVTLGMLLGGAISVAAGHWLTPLLFKESPRDPAVFGAVALTLLVTALAASSFPAARAVRVDARTALQTE